MTDRRAEEARMARVKRAGGILFTIAVLAALLGFAAWRTAEDGAGLQDPSQASLEESAAKEPLPLSGSEREVVDSAGRTVRIPEAPARMAVMDPFSGEAAIMIGAGPQLRGVPNGVRSDAILQQVFPDMDAATFATSGSTINIETLVDAECDVALVKATMGSEELAKLTRMGIPYVVVSYATFQDQLDALRLVGEVCGGKARERAQALADEYQALADAVAERVADIPGDERVRVYHAINQTTLSDAKGSIGADWISAAGCTCVTDGLAATGGSATDVTTSVETVYQMDPDLIICSASAAADEFRTDARWQTLRAVQEGGVRAMPVGATRWGQRGDVETALGMLWLAQEVYPERFADMSLRATVQRIYEEHLGVHVDDELYDQILSGQGIREAGTGNGSGQ